MTAGGAAQVAPKYEQLRTVEAIFRLTTRQLEAEQPRRSHSRGQVCALDWLCLSGCHLKTAGNRHWLHIPINQSRNRLNASSSTLSSR